MGLEIERKFLLAGEEWRALAENSTYYCQGYLYTDKECTVRVRITSDKAFLTIKGPSAGASRLEFEYPLPLGDAKVLLERLARKPLIEKIRHIVSHGGRIWEVDEFLGDNQGLVLAELELESEDQAFDKPAWVGEEVTADPRYFNASLVKAPYRTWNGIFQGNSE